MRIAWKKRNLKRIPHVVRQRLAELVRIHGIEVVARAVADLKKSGRPPERADEAFEIWLTVELEKARRAAADLPRSKKSVRRICDDLFAHGLLFGNIGQRTREEVHHIATAGRVRRIYYHAKAKVKADPHDVMGWRASLEAMLGRSPAPTQPSRIAAQVSAAVDAGLSTRCPGCGAETCCF
jgi:hypothetical protein